MNDGSHYWHLVVFSSTRLLISSKKATNMTNGALTSNIPLKNVDKVLDMLVGVKDLKKIYVMFGIKFFSGHEKYYDRYLDAMEWLGPF